MPIIVVTGKEIEKIKGDYESYLSGLNMVGKIDYSQYSQLYDEGTKHIQRAYELGKSELEKENAELKKKLKEKLKTIADKDLSFVAKFDALERENAELKEKLNFSTQYYQGEKAKEHLTKAKELLKRYVPYRQITDSKAYKDLAEETEQFMSEVEK